MLDRPVLYGGVRHIFLTRTSRAGGRCGLAYRTRTPRWRAPLVRPESALTVSGG